VLRPCREHIRERPKEPRPKRKRVVHREKGGDYV
jgi:hypothetical protein